MTEPVDRPAPVRSSWRWDARAEPGGMAPHRRIAQAALVLCLAILFWDAMPDGPPDYFYDSKAYLLWPEMPGPDGALKPSKRPPSYPLTVDLLGHDLGLARFQAVALLASFVALGWVMAGGVGALALALLARAYAISCWTDAVLTEALSLATLALLLAVAIGFDRRRARRGTLDAGAAALLGLAAWVATYLTFLRDSNVLLLPLFAVAFLRGPRRWAIVAAFVALTLVATSVMLSERERRWHPNIATAIGVRLRADPDAFAALKAEGMPIVGPAVSPELRAWLDERGRADYQRWVFSRPASYVEPLPGLIARGIPAALHPIYFPDRPESRGAQRVGDVLFQLLAPPFWLWLGLIVVPVVEWRRHGVVSATGALAALGVPVAYGFGFATYHAAANESVRHMLMGIVLVRIATLAGLVSLVRAWTRPAMRGEGGEGDPVYDPSPSLPTSASSSSSSSALEGPRKK